MAEAQEKRMTPMGSVLFCPEKGIMFTMEKDAGVRPARGGNMNNMVFHNLKIVAMGMAFLAIGACAGTPMQGYTGPVLPADQTALVSSGPYTDLVACDGTRVPGLSVDVLPGKHAIEMKVSDQIDMYGYDGAYFFYSLGPGSATFTAEAGRKYVAYVNIAPEPAREEEFRHRVHLDRLYRRQNDA